MATTQTILTSDQAKGESGGSPLRAYQIVVDVQGTYLTASKPNFNVLTALQARFQGISAVSVKQVSPFRDYYDGTNTYTAPNAQIALSGTGNAVVTFRLDSGATNGDTGAEIADATALSDSLTFLVVCTVTQ